ncbi:MAG: beta-lactamase family protein, partial [Ekhidna sp.]|nr:beta-lactamase family protein [Ekhidna sp.]
MKFRLLSLILILGAIQVFGQIDFQHEVETARFLVSEHQKMTNIPGVQVAVMIDGKMIWSEGLGYADLNKKAPVNSNTKFRIASVSKSVTSLALGKLVEDNLMILDEDVRRYVPQFPEKAHELTPRQLAASTSGIRHYTAKDASPNLNDYPSVLVAVDVFKDDELTFVPDSQYGYSSYGWVLLSAAMERAAKQSFFEIMENMWIQLGMINTSFDYPMKQIDNKSTFYVMGKNGRTVAPEENRSYMYAGGGYLSTAEDLVKMGHQLLSDEFLSSETRQILTSSHILANGDSTLYGLGWEAGQSRLGVPVIFHGGNMHSAKSHLVIYPKQKVVFAYLANTGDQVFFNDREAQSIAEVFVKTLLNKTSDLGVLDGEWKIETTSLRDKKTSGILTLSEGKGSITYKRSKK